MNSLYNDIGGELVIKNIAHSFYKHMSTLSETKSIRKMHPVDISKSEEKLFMFLSGWLGGPPLFQENFGHPMLRARHMPFKIGKSERDQWMLCMAHAAEEVQIQEPMRSEFLNALLKLADNMRNQIEEV